MTYNMNINNKNNTSYAKIHSFYNSYLKNLSKNIDFKRLSLIEIEINGLVQKVACYWKLLFISTLTSKGGVMGCLPLPPPLLKLWNPSVQFPNFFLKNALDCKYTPQTFKTLYPHPIKKLCGPLSEFEYGKFCVSSNTHILIQPYIHAEQKWY